MKAKRNITCRAIALVAALIFTTSIWAEQYVVVTGNYVRLHEKPALTSNFVRDSKGNKIYPPKGQKLKVTGNYSETWEVEYKGKVVYISKEYAKLLKNQTTTTTTTTTTTPATTGTRWVKVTGTNVRLRTSPSLKGTIFTYSNGAPVYPAKGSLLKYLGSSGDFYKVEYNGYTLYISKQFSKLQ